MLRSCYTTKVSFYSGPGQPTSQILWFFSDGVPFIPYFGVFTSGNWDNLQPLSPTALGEVAATARDWVDGSAPAVFPKGKPCGNADAWLNGAVNVPIPAPITPPSFIPNCCLGALPLCGIAQWRLVASGFSGDCTVLNGSWLLDPIGSGNCSWWFQGGTTPGWLTLNPAQQAGGWYIVGTLGGTGHQAVYLAFPAPSDVFLNVPITVPLSPPFSTCPAPPASVTLTPLS